MTILSTDDAPAEIFLPAVHPHKLKKTEPGDVIKRFNCDGCKEDGAGVRYRCEDCEPSNLKFNLHKCCALAEATLAHPLVKGKLKLLYEAPTSKDDRRLCDACGGKVRGFNYQRGDLNLHPCCANLPLLIPQEEHIEKEEEKLTFELRKEASHKCNGCGGRSGYMTFWFYRSTCKKVYLHVRCVKEILLEKQLNQLQAAAGAGGGSSSSSSSAAVAAGPDTGVITSFVKERALDKYKEKKSGKTFERILRVVATVLRVILGVLIGDPTTLLIAGAAFLSGSG